MKTKVLPGNKWTYWPSERFHAYCNNKHCLSNFCWIPNTFLSINKSFLLYSIHTWRCLSRTKHKWRPSQLTSNWCVLGNPIGLCTDIFWFSKWDWSRVHSWILRNSTPPPKPPTTMSRIVMAFADSKNRAFSFHCWFRFNKRRHARNRLNENTPINELLVLTVALLLLFSRLKFRSYVLSIVTKKSRFSSRCGWFIQGEFLMVLENNEENRFRSVISRSWKNWFYKFWNT